jgi:pimeloyl-ACP methyl ester carboxylesterase
MPFVERDAVSVFSRGVRRLHAGRRGAVAIVGAAGAPNLYESDANAWRGWAQATAAGTRAARDVLEVIEQNAAPEGIDLPPWLREMFRDSDPEMFACQLETLTEKPRPEWLQLTVPRLLLLGEQEVTPDWVPTASRALPNTEIVLLPGLGHLGGFLARDQAINAARPFLAHVTAQAGGGDLAPTQR